MAADELTWGPGNLYIRAETLAQARWVMARYRKPGRDLIYAAAERWRDEAVRRDGSLFTPGKAIWTPANLKDTEPRLAISPSPTDKFQQKLATQLSGAPAEQVQLYAEATYLYFLPTLGTLGKAKRSSLKLIQAFAPDSSAPSARGPRSKDATGRAA